MVVLERHSIRVHISCMQIQLCYNDKITRDKIMDCGLLGCDAV
jgi:hypothetical protein